MTVGSLFAGIGGFDLGFERAGFEITWQVEIDPFCREVLAKHWPKARRFTDVRKVHAEGGCGIDRVGCEYCLPAVDVICGGFPCQDISNAGSRAGITGERSGLWEHFGLIVCCLRPDYVVVENVSALLNRGIDTVLGNLAAIGYDAEWDCLPASAFGADHERDRVFIVAYPMRERLPLRGQARAHGEDARVFGKGLGFTVGTASEGLERGRDSIWRGDVHGIPDRVQRIKALGNAVYPPIAEWIAHRIKEADQAA